MELADGTIIDLGKYSHMCDAQLELDQFADDVPLHREVPQSVFIRNPQ